MTEVRVVFDPRLNITAEDFAAQWRAEPENLRIGQVATAPLPGATRTMGDPGTAMAIVTGILLGVPSNAIWDAIKTTYSHLCASRNEPEKSIEIQHTKYPDGTEVTIIRCKE